MQQPMGKKEIEEKIAARKAKEAKWVLVVDVIKLLTFIPFFGILTVNLIVEIYKILVQEIGQQEKMIWIVTQNFPTFFAWVIVFYAIRRVNKRQGW